ncbi:MAG: paraquat-inducible protein A [Rhodospirillales bacterium]
MADAAPTATRPVPLLRRLLMLAGILASLAALTIGLVLPAISIVQVHLFETRYSILGGLQALRDSREWLVFAIILLFSVIFPYVKLLLLGLLWLLPRGPRDGRSLFLLDALGKWSMLDVLVVALAVVSLQSSFFVDSRLQIGIYYFAVAALASMLLAALTRRLARRPETI